MKKKPSPKRKIPKEAWKIRLDKEWRDFVKSHYFDMARNRARLDK